MEGRLGGKVAVKIITAIAIKKEAIKEKKRGIE